MSIFKCKILFASFCSAAVSVILRITHTAHWREASMMLWSANILLFLLQLISRISLIHRHFPECRDSGFFRWLGARLFIYEIFRCVGRGGEVCSPEPSDHLTKYWGSSQRAHASATGKSNCNCFCFSISAVTGKFCGTTQSGNGPWTYELL